MEKVHYDLVIIGSGAGGGTLAYSLKDSGLAILLIERGDFIPREEANEAPDAAYCGPRYGFANRWKNSFDNQTISDFGSVYCVGGKTKFYGSALNRFRKEDFGELVHREGFSPAWPISYEELEPYYSAAERLYSVHGDPTQDPTEPFHSLPYLHVPLVCDPYMSQTAHFLQRQGLQTTPIPLGVIAPLSSQINGLKFDGFPSKIGAKADAEVCCIGPALAAKGCSLLTGTKAERLLTDPSGKKVIAVEVLEGSTRRRIEANTFVLACGAIHSPEILLKSKSASHPNGLANSSGLVGKHLMAHTSTVVIAWNFFRKNSARFQKTFQIMDYYLQGRDGWPWGFLQTLGHFSFESVFPRGLKRLGRWLTKRSIQLCAFSEDLPNPKNRIELDEQGEISLHYQSNNLLSNELLAEEAKKALKGLFSHSFTIASKGKNFSQSHACGTLRFGTDPKTSVLDTYCRAHDVPNLYVVDSSFFPSSAAVNPALTIIAQALRVGDHLKTTLGQE